MIKPRPKEYKIAVILFLSRLATKFLITIVLIAFFSKKRNRCVNAVSIVLYYFSAIILKPKMIPNRINKKIFMIIPKLNESKLRGRT